MARSRSTAATPALSRGRWRGRPPPLGDTERSRGRKLEVQKLWNGWGDRPAARARVPSSCASGPPRPGDWGTGVAARWWPRRLAEPSPAGGPCRICIGRANAADRPRVTAPPGSWTSARARPWPAPPRRMWASHPTQTWPFRPEPPRSQARQGVGRGQSKSIGCAGSDRRRFGPAEPPSSSPSGPLCACPWCGQVSITLIDSRLDIAA